MTTAALPHRALVAPGIRRRRRLRLARTRAGASIRAALVPPTADRRRQKVELCSAARTLTALGVRVQVIAPETPWPRTGRRVVSDHVGRLGDLALSAAALTRGTAGTAVVCPVAIRYRTDAGYLRAEDVPRRLADVVGTQGLVVEVRCLPALAPG